ncbi:helix-turn-helix domain-containing protein [Aquiflexum lacus]|uniref:helix-turn-helix domain-containing protein n=1 Tax=Aquiflexum lacus TaxID=2483805 RepID=UPI00189574EA|nr:helix-turn-helix domain-containing protein [Aquiflexum lacus]
MGITSFISLIGTGIGILAILILLFKQQDILFKKIVFGLMLFCMTYYCFLDFLFDSGRILDFPHFFKTGSPIFYLLPISIYWLGQSHINQKTSFQPIDYVMILLPIINIIEFLPIYRLSTVDKQDYLFPLMEDRDQIIYAFEGWIPTYFHFLFQVSLGLGVSLHLLISTILKRKDNPNAIEKNNFKWLMYLSSLFLTFYLGAFLMLVLDNETFQIHQNASWLFATTILGLLVLLFLEPSILYGNTLNIKPSPSKKNLIPIEEGDEQKYREALNEYFLKEDNFLHPDFRQQDLADYLDITKNKLSLIINQLFEQNFNQLINDKRIEIAIQKLQTEKSKSLTLEGIAQEVGFKSRTTFNKAFQEKTGLTPSEFRKNLLEG